jgi:ABC-2 type transport system ATP-binding protein
MDSGLRSMMFEVKGLCKRFGHIAALEDVSFQVRAGEVLGLIGPNGAGKSTLFECLAGVLPSDRGTLNAGGKSIPVDDRASLLFYVPDGIAPWPEQSVRWALDFTIGFLGGQRSRHVNRRVHNPPQAASLPHIRSDRDSLLTLREEVISELDLRSLLSQPVGALSKGQRKRVLLGIGLLTQQPVLLIDEPFEGLDLRQARDIATVLRTHVDRGRTLFLSIHQISDAARFCDRFVLLSGGQVRGEGTVSELAALAAAHNKSIPKEDLEEVFLALT